MSPVVNFEFFLVLHFDGQLTLTRCELGTYYLKRVPSHRRDPY